MKRNVAVIGIGNPLRKDDGVGIVVIEQLQKRKHEFPVHVEFIDGGTGGMNLLHIITKFDIVVIIDAVDFKGTPGELRFFSIDEIQNNKIPLRMSTHEPDFLKVIQIAKELNQLPEKLLFFGVQTKDLSYSSGLSSELIAALDTIKEKIHQELLSLLQSTRTKK